MDTILVVNAGSSSVKFQVLETAGNEFRRLIKGQMDGIGTRPRLRAETGDKKPLVDQSYSPEQICDGKAALIAAGAWLREAQRIELMAVGHRVVHGGPKFDRATLINLDVVKELELFIPLAPLHQPNNLAPIRAIFERYPGLPQVACFDTAFHRGHDPVADHYAIPEQLYTEGIRRYGFHGLSYEYVAERLRQVAPKKASGRVIVAHLGSGASMCALVNGRSVESTMGFTALDGLPMGTRPGQIDPGVVLYLLTAKKMTTSEVEKFFYNECGLKGISGVSNDVRELQATREPRAQLALDYFVYRVGLYAGMLAAAMGGLDAFVFTAGIGENSPSIRRRIAQKIGWLGASLDESANEAGKLLISDRESRIGLYLLPTDEELMIARHTLALMKNMRVAAE